MQGRLIFSLKVCQRKQFGFLRVAIRFGCIVPVFCVFPALEATVEEVVHQHEHYWLCHEEGESQEKILASILADICIVAQLGICTGHLQA